MKPGVRKLIKAFFYSLASLGAMYLAAEFTINSIYHPKPPSPAFPTPSTTEEARQQDIAYFRHFLELDKSYTESSRASAKGLLRQLGSNLDELTDAQFELGVARAVAAADNGHTNIWMGSFSRRHGRIPVRLYWFSDGLYVVRTHPDFTWLLGARVTAVGDSDFSEASMALRQFVGGADGAFRAYRGPVLFELPSAHYSAGLTDSEAHTTMTFALADGSLLSTRLPAQPIHEDDPLYWPANYLYATPPQGEDGWVGLTASGESTPFYLTNADALFRAKELPGNGYYLQFRANRGEGIDRFQKNSRRYIEQAKLDYLVVDQRFNGGGDYTLTEDLMRDLPELLPKPAPIYVIIGPATFSAGINSVAFLRAAGGKRVILIGEELGDRERMYGETNDFVLPNSKLGMTFNTGLHDVEHGCPPWPQCYYRNYLSDIAVGKLTPDMPVTTSYTDYKNGIDPALITITNRHKEKPQ